MSNGIDESDLLQICPYCDYSLHTLPMEHTCPECGQPFDRRWRVFGTQSDWNRWPRPRRVFIAMIMAMATTAIFVRISGMTFRILNATTVTWPNLIRIGSVYVGVGVLVLWVIYAVLRHPRRFIIVDASGVAIQHRRKGTIKHYAWEMIEKVRASFDVEVVLSIRGNARPVSLLRTSKEEARACMSAIETFKARDASDSDLRNE